MTRLFNFKLDRLKARTKLILFIFLAFSTPVLLSSNVPGIEGPPERGAMDENNVNLPSGRLSISHSDLSIGSGDYTLNHSISSHSNMFLHFGDSFSGGLSIVVAEDTLAIYKVVFGNLSGSFRYINGSYEDFNHSGAELAQVNSTEWEYTHSDGTKIFFDEAIKFNWGYDTWRYGHTTTSITALGVAYKVVYPSGYEVNVHFKQKDTSDPNSIHRIQSVTASNGLQLKYIYGANSSSSDEFIWSHPTRITAINNTIDYCNPTADSCSYSQAWSYVEYSWPANLATQGGDFIVTEPEGRTTKYTHGLYCKTGTGTSSCGNDNPHISQIKDSTSSGTVTRSFSYGNQYHCVRDGLSWDCTILKQGLVTQSNKGSATWTYNYSVPRYSYVPFQANSNGPKGSLVVLVGAGSGNPYRITDPLANAEYTLNETTGYIEEVKFGNIIDGWTNSVEFLYDAIGNLTERREIAESGSGLADIVSTANYNNNCNNIKTQKKPAWIKDANGNQTDFTYHCSSGKIATITKPADTSGVRPQTRYTYLQKYPKYKKTSNTIVQADNPIWVLAEESYCISSAATANGCTSSNDEVVTTYEYGNTANANNLLLKGIAITADGETRRTCYDYDIFGNKSSETMPKAGMSSCQ